MSEFKYDQATLGFDKNEVWDTIIFILKQNIDTETADALHVNTVGEARIHACGRASALTDVLNVLVAERQEALRKRERQII